MAKPKKKTPQAKEITAHSTVAVIVPREFLGQTTAFKLGFYHGHEKLPARAPESFIYPRTATAYAVGYMAGCAARAARSL